MLLKKLKIGQKLFLGFGIVTMIMIMVIAYSYINFRKESEAVDWSVHSYKVISESDAILTSLINMETGARGYVITGDKTFLEPFYKGKVDYQDHYTKMQELSKDSPDQLIRLAMVDKYYKEWSEWEDKDIIAVRENVSSGTSQISDLIKTIQSGFGKQKMDSIRGVLNDINQKEYKTLGERDNALKIMERQTQYIMTSGGGFATILAFIIAALVIRMVVNPVRIVTNTFKEIAEGDVDLEVRLNIDSKDELGDMSKNFNKFMTKLKELIDGNKNETWLKVGKAELNEHIRGKQDIEELSRDIIKHISKYTEAQIGALYIRNEDEVFKRIGSYCYRENEKTISEFKSGEGIVGQVALEKQPIIIRDVPEDYMKIVSGLGEVSPNNILVVPCMYEGNVEAIIEIGVLGKLSDLKLQFVNQISSNVAMSINSLKAQIKMNELLNKTLIQSEELQAQQEELRQNNTELSLQTKALKASEESLQVQQEELKMINEELEEKTQILEEQKKNIITKNKNLEKAKLDIQEKADELELANKYKSEFLANMSHELRTPLNSILVLSKLLGEKKLNEPVTEKQLEYAKTINSSGKDLLNIINDILDISKVEAGKLDISIEKVDIYDFVDQLNRSFMPIANEKQIKFNIQLGKHLPKFINTDEQRLKQIVNNLLSNAFKFTSAGEVAINISSSSKLEVSDTHQESQSFKQERCKYINISISDTGIGIPKDKQDIIFEAFKQADGSTSRKYGGTGLGLSISRQLAQLLGGAITLESEVGRGSNFKLTMPVDYYNSLESVDISDDNINTDILRKASLEVVAETDFINLPKEEAIANNQYKDIIAYDEKSILIIEDNEQFVSVLSELIIEKGYMTIVALNGQDGIEKAIKHRPQAILLDIGLPDINGWKVLEMLQHNIVTKNIPVHIISGREDIMQRKDMNNLIGYLKKPVDMNELNTVFIKIEKENLKQGSKVLIANESDDEAAAIVNILEEKGCKCYISNSGSEVESLLGAHKFDCLILDLQLKDMGALELLTRLRYDNYITIPIIIYTNKRIAKEDAENLNKYADSIIIKGNYSVERLIDEASLFIHSLDNKSNSKDIELKDIDYDKEDCLKDKKVLIVDDDMRNVFALSNILENNGLKVIVGRNGNEAMERFEQHPDTDLVLMDVMMPEMDGYDAMRELREKEKNRRIPIIAITAKAMKDDRQKCIEAGADDYLTKPIDMDKLISLLRVWLYKC
ncbi:response regulator [Clostridium fungisolvens]|uniref:Circadian input-output histidine kinase CikA n=1 Tax=Clostridium fungisolvens TaxID=1604897 RepID=A0A6V8SGA5_9CLOT|nr:response regulator [Clostridium fungisolvens]GFP74178.1 Sensor histidine kinase RcsC [Clostridium fungisolvens]